MNVKHHNPDTSICQGVFIKCHMFIQYQDQWCKSLWLTDHLQQLITADAIIHFSLGDRDVILDITWANVDPNQCRYMALLAGWVNLSHQSFWRCITSVCWHNEAETKWQPYSIWHVHMDFLEWNIQVSIKIWCLLLRAQFTITRIGSGNGLVPTSNKQSSEPQMAQLGTAHMCHSTTIGWWAVI